MSWIGKIALKFSALSTVQKVILLSLITIILRDLPLISLLFKPFRTFDFFLHEISHALVCLLTGGNVNWIKVAGGSVTDCSGGNEILVCQAGYLGQALFGACLIILSQYKRMSNLILTFIGVIIGMTNLLFIREHASVTWAIFAGAALVYAGLKMKPSWTYAIVLFLAIQINLYVVGDMELIVEHSLGLTRGIGQSDATHMARLTGLAPWIWSTIWSITSLAMLALALFVTYKPKQIETPAGE